jgi:uncharacterized protein
MRKKIYLTIVSIILVGLLAACTTAKAAPLTNETTTNTNLRTLTVTGVGQIYLVPDIAYINIGVHTEAEDVATALSSNTQQAQKVADSLINLAIDPKDIQTTTFNVYPQQKYGPNGETLGTVYVVDNTVNVTVRDLTKLGSLLDAVISAGANNINSISFDSSAKSQAMIDARKAAINDARQQAQALASAAGVTLDAIQSINVSTSTPMPTYGSKLGSNAPSAAVPVSAGQLLIEVDAYLIFSIK